MAFRIHDHITHGEIDCRVKGEVTGKLWLHGGGEPVVLKLAGNAWADMAGCLLSFVNASETVELGADVPFSRLQQGAVGDMTASRKVRLPGVPIEEFLELTLRGEKAPERLVNSLHLEWFSESNGRVVFESTECEVTLSTPEWRLTPEEEQRQRTADATAGLADFMGDLAQAMEFAEFSGPWDGGKDDQDELIQEEIHPEGDDRTDKLGKLMEKYMDHPDCERIIAREMGWDHIIEMLDAQEAANREAGEDTGGGTGEVPTAGEVEERGAASWKGDDGEPGPDPAREGKDWVRATDGSIKHPLSHRVFESSRFLSHRLVELGLEEDADEDLRTFMGEFKILGSKLAGALDGWAKQPGMEDSAQCVARLKRALTHLHSAQAALVKLEERQALPAEELERTRAELFGIREEILRLMEEFRILP